MVWFCVCRVCLSVPCLKTVSFVVDCVMMYGLFLLCDVQCLRVFNVFVCFVCDLMCDVVCFVLL